MLHLSKNKLSHRWCGTYRVTDSKSELVFEICDLSTSRKIQSHASHLCLYAEKDLGLEIDVSTLPNTMFEVERFLQVDHAKGLTLVK